MNARLIRSTFAAAVAVAAVAAAPARADLSQLKAACQRVAAEDAPAYSYRFCDDGVPEAGGRTPNPAADRAIAVPAAYAGIDGLPPVDPAGAAAVPGNAGGTVALDVDVSLPDPARVPRPASGYPLLVFMHGCCAGSKRGWESTRLADGGEKWHYNNAWFASRGYVVITYTARGFVDGMGRGSTGETHIDSLRYEINDFQHLAGQIADDPFFDVDPRRVVATGGSYGGGFSWLALTDPVWQSPGGREMRLAAVAPKYGWTDILYSLIPTGRHFYDEGPLPATDGSDSGFSPPGAPAQKIGIPIRSIIQALFLSGDLGFPSPPPNNSRTTFPQYIRDSVPCTQTLYPAESNPLCGPARERFVPGSMVERSAYFRNDFFARVARDPAYRVPVFSAGTFTDPLFPPVEHRRMAERLRAVLPDYPIQEHYGDYQHFTQNKAKEWGDICGDDRHVCRPEDHPGRDVDAPPGSRVRTGVTTALNAFLDHHVRGRGKRPPQDVTATLQVCPQNATGGQRPDEPGPAFTAASFDALTPGELALDLQGSGTTSNSAANQHGLATDPLVNTAQNGSRCPVHSDRAGPGVATYESEPLPADATMIGAGVLTVSYRASGDLQSLQLNARLYDVFPDGTAVMVDRGPRRIDPARDGTERVTFQLRGNGWRFPAGHRIRLELMQDDEPHLKRSDLPSAMALSAVRLVLPVRETSFGTDAEDGVPDPDVIWPVVRLRTVRWASSLGTGRRFRVRWRASDIGRGIRGYRAEARVRPGRRTRASRRWRRLRVTGTSARISGRPGVTYEIRVRAVDRAGNVGRYARTTVTVPYDERAARRSGPWRRTRARSAWSRTLSTCASRRCSLSLRFRGSRVAVIGPRPRRTITATAVIDGRRRTLRIPGGRPRARRVLAVLRARGGGVHRVRLRPRGGRALTVDALGVR